jgi:hypothetical protein
MRRAMNIQRPRSSSSSQLFRTMIAKALLMPISLAVRAMVQRPTRRLGPRGQITILNHSRDPLGRRAGATTRTTCAMGKATRFPKSFGTHMSLVLDTAKAKPNGMPISVAKGAMELWPRRLSSK